MNNYKQLTLNERNLIEYFFVIDKMSPIQIAKKLNRNKTTIYRELKRNSLNKQPYSALDANFCAQTREKDKHLVTINQHYDFLQFLYQNFKKTYTGIEVCVNKAKQLKIKTPTARTVYHWINDEKIELKPQNLLRSRQKFRIKAQKSSFFSKIPTDFIPISFRPKKINNRERIGDYEIDLVLSSLKGKSALLTLVDRKTRFAYVAKTEDKKMITINQMLEKIITKNNLKIQSITKDNGMEFNSLNLIANKYNFKIYTCNPFASCEKGSNENFNGLIRRSYPKGTNFDQVSDYNIQVIVNEINKMPRKIFSFNSAYEIYSRH